MIQKQLKGTDQEILVSEGLRESMNSYFYITEESICEDWVTSNKEQILINIKAHRKL